MKTIKSMCIVVLLVFSYNTASAKFLKAKVKVTGVTCSMCSNSVHKALSGLSFIESIKVDLESATFFLEFKTDQQVVIDEIRKKIEGAGFSVGELVADFKFDSVVIKNDLHFDHDGSTYHFINVTEQNLDNSVSLRFVDKGLTSVKEYKKYSGMTKMRCIKTGYSSDCCNKPAKQRIYHVTI